MSSLILPTIEYNVHSVQDIQAESLVDPKSGKRTITSVRLGDQNVETSTRFWTSLFARFGFNRTMFNYFTPEEVFARIAATRPDEKLRFSLQNHNAATNPTLLSVSNPQKPVIPFNEVMELLNQYTTTAYYEPHSAHAEKHHSSSAETTSKHDSTH